MSNSFFSSMDSMMGMDMDLDTDVVPNEGALSVKIVQAFRVEFVEVFLKLYILFFFATDGSVNEDVVITKPFGNGKMTCREIRRNSVGCLKFRNECQKCKDIQHVGEPPLVSLIATVDS